MIPISMTIDYSGDSAESGEYDKYGYLFEYGDHGDSYETYHSGESKHCGDSDVFCLF